MPHCVLAFVRRGDVYVIRKMQAMHDARGYGSMYQLRDNRRAVLILVVGAEKIAIILILADLMSQDSAIFWYSPGAGFSAPLTH